MSGAPGSAPGPGSVRPGFVFDGLTMGRASRFSTGISSFAQPELKVPMRPIMSSLAA